MTPNSDNNITPLNIYSQSEAPCSLQLLGQHKQTHLIEPQNPKREKRSFGLAPINNFIQKTYALLQEKKFQSIVSWASDSEISSSRQMRYQEDPQQQSNHSSQRGSSFRIHNVKAFEQLVLPQYFKHSNLSSFVRQLNMYNFHKVRGDKNQYQFQHQKFSRFRPQLLCQIKRKQVQSTANIPSICLISNPEFQIPAVEAQKEYTIPEKPVVAPISSVYISQQKIPISLQEMMYESPDKKENSLKLSSDDPQQLSAKLNEMQQLNHHLKKMKQIRLNLLKQLNTFNVNHIKDKFNKIIISAITSKIKQDLAESSSLNKEDTSLMGINQLIELIMDQSPPKSFEEYQKSTDPLFKHDGSSTNQSIANSQ